MPHKKSRSKSPLSNLLQYLVMLHLELRYFPTRSSCNLIITQSKKNHKFLSKDPMKPQNAEKSNSARALSIDNTNL